MRTKDDLQKTVRLNRKSCIDGNETTGWFFCFFHRNSKKRIKKKEKHKKTTWWAKRPMAMRVLRAAFPDVSYKRKGRSFAFSFQRNHGWKRGKVTLNKKAADEQFFQRLVVANHPHTRQKLLTHRENKKMDDICTHMNRTFCWEFSFHCEKQKNRLVFSLHFSRSFESYVCAIYSFFNTSTPPDREVLHAQWGRDSQ